MTIRKILKNMAKPAPKSPAFFALRDKLYYTLQCGEATEAAIYERVARRVRDEEDRVVIRRVASEELEHAKIWRMASGRDSPSKVNKIKVFLYEYLAIMFGYTFAIKLMEKREFLSKQFLIDNLSDVVMGEPIDFATILHQEEAHENALIKLLDEERLKYVGSVVLGLNDALVELTGSLTGFTFAYQNCRLIALTGLITGVAATLSMAGSEFLSSRAEGRSDALKSSIYTGSAYLVTVILLVLPFFLAIPGNRYPAALAIMAAVVLTIIFFFNYYISMAKGEPFKRRVIEMLGISVGVSIISFGIGLVIKKFLGVTI